MNTYNPWSNANYIKPNNQREAMELASLRKVLSKQAWWSYFNALACWNNEKLHKKSKIYPTDSEAILAILEDELSDFPLRIAAAELIIKMDLGSIQKQLGRIVAAIEKHPKRNSPLEREYQYFEIPKRSGATRLIQSPNKWLANIQRRIYKKIEYLATPHHSSHGFTKDHSIVSNALPHCGKKKIAHFDIQNAFGSTSRKTITGALERDTVKFNISKSAIYLLSHIFTTNNSLPTGAPSSPFILNRCLLDFDEFISTVSEDNSLSYTRYADDINISGDQPFIIEKQIKYSLAKLGYKLNKAKTGSYSRGVRQTVTGIVCNVKPNLAKTKIRKIRAAVHQWNLTGKANWNGIEISQSVLEGHIRYLSMSNPSAAAKYTIARMQRECASPDAREADSTNK